MSKTAEFGVDGIARRVKKMYFGVDGVARLVKKGYFGVREAASLRSLAMLRTLAAEPDGVARIWWDYVEPVPAQSMEVRFGHNKLRPSNDYFNRRVILTPYNTTDTPSITCSSPNFTLTQTDITIDEANNQITYVYTLHTSSVDGEEATFTVTAGSLTKTHDVYIEAHTPCTSLELDKYTVSGMTDETFYITVTRKPWDTNDALTYMASTDALTVNRYGGAVNGPDNNVEDDFEIIAGATPVTGETVTFTAGNLSQSVSVTTVARVPCTQVYLPTFNLKGQAGTTFTVEVRVSPGNTTDALTYSDTQTGEAGALPTGVMRVTQYSKVEGEEYDSYYYRIYTSSYTSVNNAGVYFRCGDQYDWALVTTTTEVSATALRVSNASTGNLPSETELRYDCQGNSDNTFCVYAQPSGVSTPSVSKDTAIYDHVAITLKNTETLSGGTKRWTYEAYFASGTYMLPSYSNSGEYYARLTAGGKSVKVYFYDSTN